MLRQGITDTVSFKGNPPVHHLLQGLHTIYANFVSKFSTVYSDRNSRNWKHFFRDFVASGTSSLDFCIHVPHKAVLYENNMQY